MDSTTGVVPRRLVHMQVASEHIALAKLPNNLKRNKTSRRVRILWSLLASPCLVIGWIIYSARRDSQLSGSEKLLLFPDSGFIPTMRSATVLPLPTVIGSNGVETPHTFEEPETELTELELDADADMDTDTDTDSQMDVDIDIPVASLITRSRPIPPHSLTAILPVTSKSLPNLRSTVTQLLADGGGYLRDIIIACPEEILLQARPVVRATVAGHGHVHGGPDISLHRFPNDVLQDQNRNVLRILSSQLSSEWVLVLPETGIDTSDLLDSPLDVPLPVGPRGFLVDDSGSNVSCASASVLEGKQIGASHVVPPFIMPSFLVFAFDDDVNAPGFSTELRAGSEVDIWAILGKRISKTRSDGFGGIVIPSSNPTKSIQIEPWCSSVLHASHRNHTNGSVTLDSVQGWNSAFEGTCAAGSENTPPWNGERSRKDMHEHTGVFSLLLPSLQDLRSFSPAACRLHDGGHVINVFLYDESPSTVKSDDDTFDEEGDEDWDEHVLTVTLSSSQRQHRPGAPDHCRLKYEIPASHMQPLAQRHHPAGLVLQWFAHLGDPPHAVLALDEKDAVTDGLAFLLTKSYPKPSPTLIRIPRENLVHSDWMGTLSLSELKNWNTPQIDISIITKDRPDSLKRLLASLSTAKYFGDTLSLRVNIEQSSDVDTLSMIDNFQWDHGDMFVHHRVIHGGLLPAVVESWYPHSNNTYGLLLEDDVELSPLFYAWVKMTVLRYRHGDMSQRSPQLFGISLYQQKNVELHLEGRRPFNARRLFSETQVSSPSTPYLSQIPCSWGAVYFPEHWREFHDYLSVRLSEFSLSIDQNVVPELRSNSWTKSWKKYFIELVYLRGYVMLYPNYEDFVSLSTNHLEVGSHVKNRSPEKKELFLLPLMQLQDRESLSTVGLLDLPGRMLPRWENLPTLNLTGSLTSLENLVEVGQVRRTELTTCLTPAVLLHDVRDLMCINDTTLA